MLKKYYAITCDWAGKNYGGYKLTWHFNQGYVIASMAKYIQELLKNLKHTPRSKPIHASHQWSEPVYGQKVQFAKAIDSAPYLDAKGTRRIQSIVGSCLYYCRDVDGTIHTALNDIGTQQAKPTTNTKIEADRLLYYLYTHPDAQLKFSASDIVLWVNSDAAYLVKLGAKSRIAGFYYLSTHPDKLSGKKTPLNVAVLIICKTIPHVMASAAEAEMAGRFMNAQEIIQVRHALDAALAHHQPPTPLKTDNSTSSAFIDNTIK